MLRNIFIYKYVNEGVYMLYIRIKGDKESIFTDIEEEFERIKFENTELNSIFLNEIEQGKYRDSLHFIDRFGDKLSTSNMSTGCKAAIVVASNPDREIDLTCVGLNARDSIIRNIRNGKIAILFPGATVDYDEDKQGFNEIDVVMDGYRFNSLERLNLYIQEEIGWDPDLNIEGIEKL